MNIIIWTIFRSAIPIYGSKTLINISMTNKNYIRQFAPILL